MLADVISQIAQANAEGDPGPRRRDLGGGGASRSAGARSRAGRPIASAAGLVTVVSMLTIACGALFNFGPAGA